MALILSALATTPVVMIIRGRSLVNMLCGRLEKIGVALAELGDRLDEQRELRVFRQDLPERLGFEPEHHALLGRPDRRGPRDPRHDGDLAEELALRERFYRASRVQHLDLSAHEE